MILILLMVQSTKIGYGFPMETFEVSPEEMVGYLEGDMQVANVEHELKLNARAGVLMERWRWPRSQNGWVIVPYIIQDGSRYSMLKDFKFNLLHEIFYLQHLLRFLRFVLRWMR